MITTNARKQIMFEIISHQVTKFQLASLMFVADAECSCQGVHGYLESMEREDGGGSSFNITLATMQGSKTFYVRTID